MMESTSLKVKKLSFRYLEHDFKILNNINLSLESGDMLHIKGHSGSGKSTLLFSLCRIVPDIHRGYFSGEVLINDKNINQCKFPDLSTKISLLFQESEYQLFFPIVEQEMVFPLENRKKSKKEIKYKIEEITELLCIEKYLELETEKLSYGEKKIIAYASILTLDPTIILLDEPLSGLSPEFVNKISKSFDFLVSKKKIVILTEHNEINSTLNFQQFSL